ncbi:hypothetical protein OCU04_005798 [Sclerotinia nivalis]|uniref:F-box domain-containing protein n=1 Tax=Sclerotinia nivalis TaxID=352851 RepID=A0A9X0DJW6_9HELO|nr:hypothetical protein OCU04_005798 [Sclerotinia nivalis]
MFNLINTMFSGGRKRSLHRKPILDENRYKSLLSSLESALKISTIEKLPAEVWIHILDQLPISSAAAASICSPNIKGKMRDRYLRLLVTQPDEMILFLELLAIDLPNHVACEACLKLHCMDNALSLQTGYRPPKPFDTSNMKEADRVVLETWDHLNKGIIDNPHRLMNENNGSRRGRHARRGRPQPECDDRRYTYLGWDFNTAIWEMAMKRYNLGQDYASLLNIMSGITSNNNYLFSLEWQQPRVDHTIAHGFMIQRVQRIAIVDAMLPSYRNRVCFDICQHWDWFGDENGAHIKNRWEDEGRGLSAGENIQIEGDSGLWRCTQCWTEFQINVENSDKNIVMIITRWKNLGLKPDKHDENFKRHLGLLDQTQTQTQAQTQRHDEQVWANPSETMMKFQNEVTGLTDLSPLSKAFTNVGELVSSPSYRRKVFEEHEEKRDVNLEMTMEKL